LFFENGYSAGNCLFIEIAKHARQIGKYSNDA